jgi:lysylphosphatidylglycerol synthetase-like protein (DUF2156 family)
MSVDTELDNWRRAWQSEAPAMPDLAAKVKQQSRRLWMLLAGEILVTAVIGGCAIALAVRIRRADFNVLAAAVWVFLGVAWAYALRSRRGCWAPAALDTAAFLDISIRRVRAAIATAAFGVLLAVCELLFSFAWIYRYKSHESALSLGAFLASPTVIAVAVFTVALAACAAWYRRRKRIELAWLLKLRREASEPAPDRQPAPVRASRFRFRRRRVFR